MGEEKSSTEGVLIYYIAGQVGGRSMLEFQWAHPTENLHFLIFFFNSKARVRKAYLPGYGIN